MKKLLNTTARKRNATSVLVAIAGLAILHTQALAGGPAWLRLPIDGTTKGNEEADTTVVREKLKPYVMQSAGDLKYVTVKDGFLKMPLAAKPVSLADLQAGLEGTEFSIPGEQLHFNGALRIEIDSVKDLDKLTANLRVDPKVEVSTKKLENGRISIFFEGQRSALTPLITYKDLNRILSGHGAKLLDVKWGADPKNFGNEDFAHWFCGPPFGAVRMADVKSDAPKKASKAEVSSSKTGAVVKKSKSTAAEETKSKEAGL